MNSIEKTLVLDFIGKMKEDFHGKPIKERYNLFIKAKAKSNSIVLCLSCMTLRNRYKDDKNCSEEPDYDLNTTYTKILEMV